MRVFLIALMGSLFAMPVSAGQFNVETVNQADVSWRFQRIHASATDNAVVVSGRLTASTRFGLPRGHIDVAAFAPSGALLAETTTSYKPGILTRRMQRRGGLRFQARLDQKLPPDTIIKVAFHREPFVESKPPTHTANIAR